MIIRASQTPPDFSAPVPCPRAGVTGARPRSYFSPTPRSPSPSPLSSALKRGRQLPARLQGARGVVGSGRTAADSCVRGSFGEVQVLPPLMLAFSFARSVESASCVLSRPPPTPFFWWFGGRLGRVLVRVVGGFHSPVVRFVCEMLVCAISPFRLVWISFPLWWFQHLDACERGCGVMVHAESDVSNYLSIVDFEV